MAAATRRQLASEGTRFRLFPQPSFLEAYRDPVVVTLSPPAGSVLPGPSDGRAYAVLPIGKTMPYGDYVGPSGRETAFLPPWRGPRLPPAMPDRRGHFDHLDPSDPCFPAAHAYAVVRFVLDVWEPYTGFVPWHFARAYPRLEIGTLADYDNAQSGYGFLELGTYLMPRGPAHPYALNFDVIAHELGHLFLFSILGFPRMGPPGAEFRGFHESMGDLVALIAASHFDAVLDDVLETTRGNLYVVNELNRFAELTSSDQIRIASNSVKLSEFAVGWRDEHDLSLPLTGAIFDILIEIYQILLAERRVIDPVVVDLSTNVDRMLAFRHAIDAIYQEGYAATPLAFKQAFMDARNLMAAYLARVWRSLTADGLSYVGVGRALLAADRAITGGRFLQTIEDSFAWREIWTTRVGPLLSSLPTRSHIGSVRTWTPPRSMQRPASARMARRAP
jgi:hypothetical protein